MPFVIELLLEFRPVGSAELLSAGVALSRLIHLIDTSPLNMTEEQLRESKQSGVRFLTEGIRAGIRPIAKVHQLLHLLHDAMVDHGNAKYYSCFFDESLNKDLAGVARIAYSSVWAPRIFACWKRLRKTRRPGLLVGVE